MSKGKKQSMRHKKEYETLRENIKFYRMRKKLTQANLAELVGVSLNHIAAIEAENVDRSLSLELVFCIADALEVEVYKLFLRHE